MTKSLKHKSHELTDGPGRAPARAMLKAVGFTDDDLAKPLIGVAFISTSNPLLSIRPAFRITVMASGSIKVGTCASETLI